MNHNYGTFVAHCERDRAPVHVDRVYNLARLGYYSDNYFFRVLPKFVAQFGTSGDPYLSNIYNYTTTTRSTTNSDCAILKPQPPFMPYCMGGEEAKEPIQSLFARLVRSVLLLANNNNNNSDNDDETLLLHEKNKNKPMTIVQPTQTTSDKNNCTKVNSLSNTFGTISMSTSYNKDLPGYPEGVTWNATAELFINLADNQRLDQHLFVPICTVEQMDTVVKFPSFGEVSDLGGPGPSLGLLYEQGNAYIESNSEWKSEMAKVERVTICDE
ncbi:unnamed protein product [Cylindrotheca closterium]|uniref:PPIase cyclophilin-type domain-containing protein n=1 Tax=Cylindrotheca closterium TaxID=2856 RepID=A0AAD2GCF1_9STRA|nr:unnamed protein product [Cylindrotheca closterium]